MSTKVTGQKEHEDSWGGGGGEWGESKDMFYWVIQRSWFAGVNVLCNLLCKKLREVAAHFRADF